MGNTASESCDTQINFHLFRGARSFGVRAAFFLWHSGWRRSDAGFPELRSTAEWCPPGRHSPHTRHFHSAALDRRRDGGGAPAAASLGRGRCAVPYTSVQRGEPVRPSSATVVPIPAFCDLGASGPVEIPFPVTGGEAVHCCGPRIQVLVCPQLHEPVQSRIRSGVRSRGPSLEAQDRASVPLPALGA